MRHAGPSLSVHPRNFPTEAASQRTLCQFKSYRDPSIVHTGVVVPRLERGAGNFYIIKVPETRIAQINLQEKTDLRAR